MDVEHHTNMKYTKSKRNDPVYFTVACAQCQTLGYAQTLADMKLRHTDPSRHANTETIRWPAL